MILRWELAFTLLDKLAIGLTIVAAESWELAFTLLDKLVRLLRVRP